MSDKMKIDGPVEIRSASKEAVAFELYKWINHLGPKERLTQLEIFSHCLLTVQNPSLGLEKAKQAAEGN